jgi:hypothetical protein
MKYLSVALHGGLGNRLFQAAAMHSLAKQTGRQPIITSESQEYFHNEDCSYNFCFKSFPQINMNGMSKMTINEHPNEPSKYISNLADIINASGAEVVCLNGYFQTDKYFFKHKEDIVQLFKAPDETINNILSKYPNIANIYVLHNRTYSYGNENTFFHGLPFISEYFSHAIKLLPDNFQLIILTDNKQLNDSYPYLKPLKLLGNRVIVVQENALISFYMMSLCKGVICSNSSFSWWGSYLNKNPNKLIIMPNCWYNPIGPGHSIDVSDMYPESVVKIDENGMIVS